MESRIEPAAEADRPFGGSRDAMTRIESWLALPASDRAELLNGRIVYKAMASIEHGSAIIIIAQQLGRALGPNGKGGGWWISQEVDLFLSGQGLLPDVVGWRIDQHPRPPRKVNVGKHLGVYVAPPDWVCEVLSGSTQNRDQEDGVKWQAYHDAGVGHYWLVDLQREQITVYQRGPRSYEPIDVAGRSAVKPLPPFAEIEFAAERVFLVAGLVRSAED